MERLLAYWYTISRQSNSGVNLVEFLIEGDNGPVLSLYQVKATPAELEDNRHEVKDPLEEINVGTADEPQPLFISALLPQPMKVEFCKLLEEFKDCSLRATMKCLTLIEHWSNMKCVLKPVVNPLANLPDDSSPEFSST